MIIDEDAAPAARLLGISYSPALTGFQFRGKHGSPIIQGAVVASEYAEAVRAVIDGFHYQRERDEEEKRSLRALWMWTRFLKKLRIKERVDAYALPGEEVNHEEVVDDDEDGDDDETFEDDGKGMESEEYDFDDLGGGGFLPE